MSRMLFPFNTIRQVLHRAVLSNVTKSRHDKKASQTLFDYRIELLQYGHGTSISDNDNNIQACYNTKKQFDLTGSKCHACRLKIIITYENNEKHKP